MHSIACIEDPVVIRKILNHLQEKSTLDAWHEYELKRL